MPDVDELEVQFSKKWDLRLFPVAELNACAHAAVVLLLGGVVLFLSKNLYRISGVLHKTNPSDNEAGTERQVKLGRNYGRGQLCCRS